jgi:hypothetical protein
MTLMTRRMAGASAFAFFFAASMAGAQEPQTIRIRGTIQNVDGPKLAIKARDGSTMQVKLGDNAPHYRHGQGNGGRHQARIIYRGDGNAAA